MISVLVLQEVCRWSLPMRRIEILLQPHWQRPPTNLCKTRTDISLDRFILLSKGIPAGFSLLLLSIPYGMTTNYVAMYAKQIGIQASTGFFFHHGGEWQFPRLFSGRLVDRGMVTRY